MFEIQAVVGYKKENRKDLYKVVWTPRRLCAHETYPVSFPELLGKHWPLNDVENWIGTGSDYWNSMKKNFKDIMEILKTHNNNNNNNNNN